MKKTIYSAILFLIIGLFLPQFTLAIGQMTKPIVFEDVLRGQEVQETLLLSNSEEKEVVYGLMASGDIKDWTTFYSTDNLENSIKEIKIPAKSQINVLVKFNVPKDTPNGTYTGQAAIFINPEQGDQTKEMNVAVGLSVGREVTINVTDKENIKFETTIIPLKYAIGKGKPLNIKVIYDNQGNVSIKPDIQLKITEISTGNVVQNVIYPYPENEEAVKPFERKEFKNLIEWQTTGQENGKYKAEIKVIFNGVTYKEKSFRFDIGTDIMAMLLGSISFLGGGNLTFGWLVMGSIILIIAGTLVFFTKKPQPLKVE